MQSTYSQAEITDVKTYWLIGGALIGSKYTSSPMTSSYYSRTTVGRLIGRVSCTASNMHRVAVLLLFAVLLCGGNILVASLQQVLYSLMNLYIQFLYMVTLTVTDATFCYEYK